MITEALGWLKLTTELRKKLQVEIDPNHRDQQPLVLIPVDIVKFYKQASPDKNKITHPVHGPNHQQIFYQNTFDMVNHS